MESNKFIGSCGVQAQVSSKAEGIRFSCPKCKRVHDFKRLFKTYKELMESINKNDN